MTSRIKRIDADSQLLVEGKDDELFMKAVIKHLEIDRNAVQIQVFEGVDKLRTFLEAFVAMPNFQKVKKIGIVRDADDNANGAFVRVKSALKNAGLSEPSIAGKRSDGYPEVSVMILPDNSNPGMLETLLYQTIIGTKEDECITEFFKCIPNEIPKNRMPKAQVRAWISAQTEPYVSVGVAAQKRFWELDHSAFKPICGFLRWISGQDTGDSSTAELLK